MAMRIGINGFGRIGRSVFRILAERDDIEVVAINDLFDNDQLAYLLRYDTVMGRFQGEVESDTESLVVNGARVAMTAVPDPARIPWRDLGVDYVIESTGIFRDREALVKHLDAGARKVILTVPPKDAIDAMVVIGVNDAELRPEHQLVSNASCTTNCLAPIAKILDDAFGLEEGFMTTVHAYTNDQRLADVPHKDFRRSRAAAENIIPTTTGAARAVGKVLPQLAGKLDGIAIRVPVPDGSIVDLVCRLRDSPSAATVNDAVQAQAAGPLHQVVEYSEAPLVSSDIIGNPHSSIFDALSTQSLGDGYLKIISWYDNEWGYANRVVDLLGRLHESSKREGDAVTRGTIGILTGGGDVPGLNPAIRALTVRALREGYRVLGIRHGWAGLVDYVREPGGDNTGNVEELTEEGVRRAARTGGTFLHTSRTRPSHLPLAALPPHLRDRYADDINDVTPEVLANIEHLGIDWLIPIGGDDTLSYGQRLHEEGIKVIAVPKTMDNDVPGTDYCIGFSTCVTRTMSLSNQLRTSAGSHERFLVIEVFGRYAGFTALLPTMAGAADRCVIPEHPFAIEQLCERLSEDHRSHSSRYAVVLVSEGARPTDLADMAFEGDEQDQYGHRKLGGVGDLVATRLKELSPRYDGGHRINVIAQRLGYLVRCGEPDALDSIVPMAFGNLALDLILAGTKGRLVSLRKGCYDDVPIGVVTERKKLVDVGRFYNPERLRPRYETLHGKPLFIMTSE